MEVQHSRRMDSFLISDGVQEGSHAGVAVHKGVTVVASSQVCPSVSELQQQEDGSAELDLAVELVVLESRLPTLGVFPGRCTVAGFLEGGVAN